MKRVIVTATTLGNRLQLEEWGTEDFRLTVIPDGDGPAATTWMHAEALRTFLEEAASLLPPAR